MESYFRRRPARASYQFESVTDEAVTIRDVGPWDEAPSVTNDAEAVVEELVAGGHLVGGRRLYYYDSEGVLDEIVVADGRFAGFRPGPGRGQRS